MRSWLSLGGLGVRIVESRAKSESGEKSKEEEREREWAEMRELSHPRLRAVSYFSLQSYYTQNLSTRAAKPLAARNEGVSPRRRNKRLLTLLFCLGTTKLSR